jgi:uncharacterized protein
MGQPVVHWELTARNPRRLEGFYSDLFDWSVNGGGPIDYRQIDTGSERGIHGGIAESGGSWPSAAMFYVQVDDVESYLGRAESLGASTLLPPTSMADGTSRIAIFRDPEGIAVGLMER